MEVYCGDQIHTIAFIVGVVLIGDYNAWQLTLLTRLLDAVTDAVIYASATICWTLRLSCLQSCCLVESIDRVSREKIKM